MPKGMTYDKMIELGFTNMYGSKPKEEGEYEVMCKAGHIHIVKYQVIHIGTKNAGDGQFLTGADGSLDGGEKGEKMAEDKIYEFEGKYYSNTDHSLEVADDKWGGDLFDLYWDASHGSENGILCEETVYYSAYNPETRYADADELVENYFENYEVQFEDIKEAKEDV